MALRSLLSAVCAASVVECLVAEAPRRAPEHEECVTARGLFARVFFTAGTDAVAYFVTLAGMLGGDGGWASRGLRCFVGWAVRAARDPAAQVVPLVHSAA